MKKVTDPSILEKLNQSEEPDYSQQYKRNFGDTIRDTAYGAVHAPWEIGKLGGNLLTGGHLEEIPGYKQYVPFMEKMIESIKSPYPSPGGDAAKLVGEFALPEAKGVKLGYQALKKGASKLPAITQKGMSKLYSEADKIALEEDVKGLQHPPELIKQTQDFLKKIKFSAGNKLKNAESGEYGAGKEIKNIFGKLSRRLPYNSAESIEAEGLHADWVKSLTKAIKEGGFKKTHEAHLKADTEYARSQKLRKVTGEVLKYGTGLNALKAALGVTKHL